MTEKYNIKTIHPFLTAEIPGIGGVIKESPEDFMVEEIPSYLPSGSGEHCYLTIEKRGITTLEAIRRIAAKLKIKERDIGYAGMKDAVGVTRQTISVQWLAPDKALSLEFDGLRILSADRHANKLKLGHLKGNLFHVVVRGVSENAVHSVPAILDILQKRGVPNFFGYQRYGLQGNSHLIGAAMLKKDWKSAVDSLIGEADSVWGDDWVAAISSYKRGDLEGALRIFPRHCRSERDVLQRLIAKPGEYEKAFSAVHPRLKKLYLSAAQSFLFDQTVAERIENIDQLMDGDLAIKHQNGACFIVKDLQVEKGRGAEFEISASGPMFGCKMKSPEGAVLDLENKILNQSGLELSFFDMPGALHMDGERRPLRVPVTQLSYQLDNDLLRLEFALPKGSYATSLLREITRQF